MVRFDKLEEEIVISRPDQKYTDADMQIMFFEE